jgi:hypothetical protein
MEFGRLQWPSQARIRNGAKLKTGAIGFDVQVSWQMPPLQAVVQLGPTGYTCSPFFSRVDLRENSDFLHPSRRRLDFKNASIPELHVV